LRVRIEFNTMDIETVKEVMGTLYGKAKKGDIISDVVVMFIVEKD